MMRPGKPTLLVAALLAMSVVSGCDAEHQARLSYLGSGRSLSDEQKPLDQTTLEALRARVGYQAWPSNAGAAMTPATIYYAGTNVRPPGAPDVTRNATAQP
jgi:hypothetical protein